jgi:hypothetical protein
MNALPEEIERLALLGWRLYPCSSRDKRGCIKGGTDAATCDLDQLAAWSRAFPDCNWRVVMEGSALWALDVDAPGPDHAADGISAMAALVRQHGHLPPQPRTRSGGGGAALFFRHDGEPIAGKTGTPAPGLDPRRGRLSVTIPPSVHVTTGRPYRWLVAPWDVAPPPAPAWLLRLMAPAPQPVPVRRPFVIGADPDKARRYAAAALRNATARVASAGSGTRNDMLNSQCYAMARFIAEGSLSGIEVAQAMAAAALQVGLDAREAAATIASALRARWAA